MRNLEREIAAICRKVASDGRRRATRRRWMVTPDVVGELLGAPTYRARGAGGADASARRGDRDWRGRRPAATILFIEATRMQGSKAA